MAKNKNIYIMSEHLFNKIIKREKKIPICSNCGKVLFPNSVVVSLHRTAKTKVKHPRRYCFDCKEKLNIWV